MANRRATAYISFVIGAGCLVLYHAISQWHVTDWPRLLIYTGVSLIASRLKVSLPGVTGTMSMTFLLVLICIPDLGLAGTLVVTSLGMIAQCVLQTGSRPRLIQVVFSVSSIVCSIQVCDSVFWLGAGTDWVHLPMRLLLAASAFFVINTLSVAAVIALTESKRTATVWREVYFWSFPNYLLAAAVAWGSSMIERAFGWQASLLLLPVLFVVYRSHSLYLSRLEDQQRRAEAERAHAQEVAALHRRTIETLALAIEAKDQTTHDHLRRVEVYAVEVGRELGLDETQLEALRAAALLHDVGKIAVPEHIISKPGKLTPEEFEKIKTHTVVGAEIVEQIRFPYDVAPFVRAHHEKWNGSGYPDGLAGEQIPIGGRILAAVDTLDALTSDRQYRRAMAPEDAIKIIQDEAGKSFDPNVVEILARRYAELDQMAKAAGNLVTPKFSTDVKVVRGEAPAAGFEKTAPNAAARSTPAGPLQMASEDAVGLEIRRLSQAVSEGASCEAAIAALRQQLPRMVPYDLVVLYVRRGDHLVSAGFDGAAYKDFAGAEIPLGAGMSGWVAENGRSIINGNPLVEPGYLIDPERFRVLQSAMAVPIDIQGGTGGVLSIYRCGGDAFSTDELSVLQKLASALSPALESPAGARPADLKPVAS